jgi:hypothetical protein
MASAATTRERHYGHPDLPDDDVAGASCHHPVSLAAGPAEATRQIEGECDARAMRVTVEFSWREVGRIVVEAGKLRFPDIPDGPGIYRFDLGDRVYIGEADRLRRRFRHYRTPGPSQTTNLRLNAAMVPLLLAGGVVIVCTVTEAQLDVDGAAAPLDLSRKASRLLVESAALTAARVAGEPVENL